jgi:predicted DNA binding CopG/RHH family protein
MEMAHFDIGEVLRKELDDRAPKSVWLVIANPLIMKEMVKHVGIRFKRACTVSTRPVDAESVERGEWKSAGGGKRERARFSRYAKATFRKDRRLNIRLSSKDLEAIQKRALAEGLPYQTLIASLLHKYASGRLKEV